MRGITKFILALVAVSVTVLSYSEARAQNFTVALMNAYSCSDATYGTSGSYWSGNGTYDERTAYTATCASGHTSNAAGSVITAGATLRAATAQTVGLVSSRIASLKNSASRNSSKVSVTAFNLNPDLDGGEVGLAGGDATKGLGVWVQGRYTDLESDASASVYDGNLYTVMAGIDKRFSGDKGIIGIAAGYEGMDVNTTFNSGNLDTDGFIVAPYFSYQANKMISFDATAGYASIDYDVDRLDPSTDEKFTGKTDANRMFGSMFAHAQTQKDKVTIGGKLGLAYSSEDKDAFTETGTTGTEVSVAKTKTHLGQALLGASLGYDGGKVDPFVNVTGEYDFNKSSDPTVASSQTQPADDNFGLRVGLGVNIDVSPNVTAHISGDTVLLRDDYKEFSGTVRLRAEF